MLARPLAGTRALLLMPSVGTTLSTAAARSTTVGLSSVGPPATLMVIQPFTRRRSIIRPQVPNRRR